MSEQIEKSSSNAEMTFFEHLDALRPHLMRGAIALILVSIGAFIGKEFIIDNVIFGPQSPDFITNRLMSSLADLLGADVLRINTTPMNLINTKVAGQFILHMKVSLFSGLIVAVPYLVWELWRFIKPALTRNEVKNSQMFVFYVSLCFFSGIAFGYFILSPISISFFSTYEASKYITNMVDIGSYMSIILNISLSCGLIFQLPILVFFLVKMGIISSNFMIKYRKHAIVVLLIFAAIITPPDVISQTLVMFPMYGLYELSIVLAKRIERKAKEIAVN